jgi:hypothetical protein
MDVVIRGPPAHFKYKGVFDTCMEGHRQHFCNAALADIPRTPSKFLPAEKGSSQSFLTESTDKHRAWIDGGSVCGRCEMRIFYWHLEFVKEWAGIKSFDTFLPAC